MPKDQRASVEEKKEKKSNSKKRGGGDIVMSASISPAKQLKQKTPSKKSEFSPNIQGMADLHIQTRTTRRGQIKFNI